MRTVKKLSLFLNIIFTLIGEKKKKKFCPCSVALWRTDVRTPCYKHSFKHRSGVSVLELLLQFPHHFLRDEISLYSPVTLGRLRLSKCDWKFTNVTATCFCYFMASNITAKLSCQCFHVTCFLLKFPQQSLYYRTHLISPNCADEDLGASWKVIVPWKKRVRETWQQQFSLLNSGQAVTVHRII